MNTVLNHDPAVFAVGNNYKIFVPVAEACLMWIRVGDECYYDHSNGVLRSAVTIHKITVPSEALDKEKKYTVCYRKMIERKPYFSKTGDIEEIEYSFRPIEKLPIRIFQIADAHGMIDPPVGAAKKFEEEFGKIDLLVLNGDVISHSGAAENFDAFYSISSAVTKGEIPIVFSRGNHDTRGIYAESIEDYSPTDGGRSYFTFRLGPLWGIVLDFAEDKPDDHPEYGNTICAHAFRKEETAFLEAVTENGKEHFDAKGIRLRIVISHAPFTKRCAPPFNIEEDIAAYWAKLLRERVSFDLMLAGHTHTLDISLPGSELDAFGQPCPLVIGSKPDVKQNTFIGSGVIMDKDETLVVFCDKNEIRRTAIIKNGEKNDE